MIVSLQTMSRSLGLVLACVLLALANEGRAANLVLPQAKPVKLAGDFKFTEGPAVSANGDGEVDEAETTAWMEFLCEHAISHCNWALNDKVEGA